MKKRFLLANIIIVIAVVISLLAISGCYQLGRLYGTGCRIGCDLCAGCSELLCVPACAGCMDGCAGGY